MTKEYVTREELKEVIIDLNENTKSYIEIIAKQLGDRVDRAIRESKKESDERIMMFEKEQTDRLVKVIDSFATPMNNRLIRIEDKLDSFDRSFKEFTEQDNKHKEN